MKVLALFIGLILGVAGTIGINAYFDRTPDAGATTARTTITNPWTFSATTTMSANLTVTTTNSATSSVYAGCYQLTATSTANPMKLLVTSVATTAPTFQGSVTGLAPIIAYGTCPRI